MSIIQLRPVSAHWIEDNPCLTIFFIVLLLITEFYGARGSVVHLCCFFDEICYGTIGGSLCSTILRFFFSIHFFCSVVGSDRRRNIQSWFKWLSREGVIKGWCLIGLQDVKFLFCYFWRNWLNDLKAKQLE